MEMVETKVIAIMACIGLACSCSNTFSWEKFVMDGHRTGVTAPTTDNVPEALGVVNDSVYVAPNGKVFPKGSSTYEVASGLIAVQPEMAELKSVIGYSTKEMLRAGANCELSNWIVDRIMVDVAALTGKKVDVGIMNSGGIRVDMPQGNVLRDDIESMLPFKNYLCYVALKGEDLRILFESMAEKSIQPCGGVKVVVDGNRLDTLLVGGEPVDPERIYGVATIDFLLDGGDKINVGRNAKDVIITDSRILDAILPYAMSYAEQGKPIEYFVDDRVVIRGREGK